MSYLKNFFGAQQDDIHQDWKTLNSLEQLDQIVKDSFEKPVVLFKHSIRCGISSGAKYGLEKDWNFNSTDLDFYYLDLINFRPVSNKIAEQFNVIHQSPQVIVLKNGKAVHHTSHHQISVSDLENALASN